MYATCIVNWVCRKGGLKKRKVEKIRILYSLEKVSLLRCGHTMIEYLILTPLSYPYPHPNLLLDHPHNLCLTKFLHFWSPFLLNFSKICVVLFYSCPTAIIFGNTLLFLFPCKGLWFRLNVRKCQQWHRGKGETVVTGNV